MRKLLLTVQVVAVLLACGVASAQEGGSAGVEHKLAVTISPIHLALPIVELTGEYAVQRKLGVAVIAGVGSVGVDYSDGTSDSFTAWELGASGRYYVLGDFDHGMQVGAEVMFLGISGDAREGTISASGQGLTAGGFVGYKIAADFGLTFDGQVGYQAILVGAQASDGEESASTSDSSGGVLLNLNVGWSF